MFDSIKKMFTKNEVVDTAEKEVAKNETVFDTSSRNNLQFQINKSNLEQAYSVFRSVMTKENEKARETKLADLFPRTIDDFKCVAIDQKTEVSVAMDGINSFLHDTQNNYILKGEIIDRMSEHFIGWSACAALSQNWIISRACSIPAEDAIASGFRFSYANEEDLNKDGFIDEEEQEANEQFLKDILQDAEDYTIAEVCKKANFLKKVFGYCLIVPVVDGADMSKPFNIDGIRKGTYKGMSVIEPMWITPQFDADSRNPMNKDFYEPSSYVIAGSGGKVIHKSWIIKLINAPVPDILKPVYYFGGVPLTQMIFERVYCAEGTANEAPMLAKTKRLLHMVGDLENAISNPDLFAKRMSAFNELRDNFSIAFVPDGTEIGQFETTLTDLDVTIMTQFQLVSSIAQMPVTKLLKVQIKGFNSSGQYEMDDYNQTLVAIQNNDFKPIIKFHNELLMKSKYGKDTALNIIFGEIDSPSAEENARIRLTDAQRDSILIGAGVISADEVRNKMRNDENSLYTTIADEKIEDFEDDDFIAPDIDNKNNDKEKIVDKNNEEIEIVEKVKNDKTTEIIDNAEK